MVSPPKTPEELYEFFMYIANPPVKSHIAYDVNMAKYIRENWAMYAYLDRYNRYGLWFHYKESDPPRWNAVYEKYKTKE